MSFMTGGCQQMHHERQPYKQEVAIAVGSIALIFG